MANNQAISKEQRRYLPSGYGKKLASQFNCSVSKVYHVTTGDLTDYNIMEAMLDIIQRNIAIERRMKLLNQQSKRRTND